MALRNTSVAGTFFPDDKPELKKLVSSLLSQAAAVPALVPEPPIAILAPHAGYAYSGALTAAAWQAVRDTAPARIAILSPSHHLRFAGLAVPDNHNGVALPGLRVRIDTEACAGLVKSGFATPNDDAFDREHGIDTQLPFARSVLSGVPVVPVVIGDAGPDQVAAVVDALAALQGRTLFVLSSDLSHYLTEDAAQKRDVRTAALIEAGHGAVLTSEDACGARAIAGFLASRTGLGCRPLRLGRYTSKKTTGQTDRVVGYGAWAFFGREASILNDALRAELLSVARKALAHAAARGRAPQVRVDSFAPPLRTVMASFVTLEQAGRLRGCIGSLAAVRPLVADVVTNAVKAGLEDPRFGPVTPDEVDALHLSVSVLTRPLKVAVDGRDDLLAHLVPGQTGAIVQDGNRRGVFLPTVWQSLPEPEAFLGGLMRKAGLAPDHWSDSLTVHLFRSESFSEKDMQAEAA